MRAEDVQSGNDPARQRATAPVRRRPILWPILIGLAFAGAIAAGFAAGILITIKKDGWTYQVDVPENSKMAIDKEGNATVTLPGEAEIAKAPVASAAADLKALQRQWKVVRIEQGSEIPRSWPLPGGHMDIKGIDRFSFQESQVEAFSLRGGGGQTFFMRYRILGGTMPVAIDFFADSREKNLPPVALGIYEIDGDRLTLRMRRVLADVNNQVRPTSLTDEPTPNDICITLERYWVAGDEIAVRGCWDIVREIDDGKLLSQEPAFDRICWFYDNSAIAINNVKSLQGIIGGRYVMEGQASKAKAITIWQNGGKDLLGIYEFRGKQLHIAYRPGGPRPETFESTPGSGVTLLVLERSKARVETGSAESPWARNPVPAPTPQPSMGTDAFRTTTVTRGDIAQTISASGTIEPQEVVDVGAEVTGNVVSLGADPRGKSDPNYKDKTIDYGSPVEQNMILARIDDTLYKVRVDQQKAGCARAEAELAVARAKAKGETSEAAKAAVVAAEAAVAQAKAALLEAQINLALTTVKSPAKGVIVARRVNFGQNVGPSPNSPGLFLIATDLGKVQIWASVNKADIGRIHKGMEASFTVDAFPKDVFKGTVTQIRLDATLKNKVVTYTVVVEIEKPVGKLMPYMTANVLFHVTTKEKVLRVDHAALEYWPPSDLQAPEFRASTPGSSDLARWDPPRLWVVAADGSHVRPVFVQLGLRDRNIAEVSGAGVKEGMQVVVGRN